MNRTIVSLAVAAVAAGSVTFVAVDGPAAAATTTRHPATHTLKIRVTGLDGGGRRTKSGFVAASKVTSLHNKFLGYVVDSALIGASGITDRSALALDGGIMYVTTTVTDKGEKGNLTGGVGRFAGAKGTIVSTSFDEKAQTATYTITWHK